jgi:hypothetical protein
VQPTNSRAPSFERIRVDSRLGARIFFAVLLFALAMPGGPAFAQPAPDWPAPTALARIIKADFAATHISSVLFGAWIGASPVLVSALGDSPQGAWGARLDQRDQRFGHVAA